MAHKYEEELEILKERICRDVRESIKEFLNADPEQGMHYDVPLEKHFAEVCEDIADRVSNMANNLHYKAMDKQTTRAWTDAETIDRLEMKKTYVITYTDEIEAACAEDAYRVLLDMLSSDVQFQDISAFDIKEKPTTNPLYLTHYVGEWK